MRPFVIETMDSDKKGCKMALEMRSIRADEKWFILRMRGQGCHFDKRGFVGDLVWVLLTNGDTGCYLVSR